MSVASRRGILGLSLLLTMAITLAALISGLPGSNAGGPFTLADGQGKVVRDSDFRGRFMVVFFGYTYCPDVCPSALGKLASVLDRLSRSELDRLAVIFISVDPARDQGTRLTDYGQSFHPHILGLTGTPEQIAAVTKAYGAKFRIVGDTQSGDYAIDHSAFIYLMGPDGRLITTFAHDSSAMTIEQRLKRELQ